MTPWCIHCNYMYVYLVPFLRYSALNNGVTLKSGLGSFKVIEMVQWWSQNQGHNNQGQGLDVKANEFIKWMVSVIVINKTKHGANCKRAQCGRILSAHHD